MPKFVLVREEDLKALEDAREDLEEMRLLLKSLDHSLTRLQGTGRIEIDPEAFGLDAAGNGASDVEERSYKIGRGEGKYTYADVAYKVVDRPEFPISRAWDKVEPVIVTTSKRARDSFRRSLDMDDRFKRIEKDDDDIWYRRIDEDQLNLTGD